MSKKYFTIVFLIIFYVVNGFAQEEYTLSEDYIVGVMEAKASRAEALMAEHVIIDHRVDIRKYTLELEPSFSSGNLSATAEIKMKSMQDDLDYILLNFIGSWNISQVTIDNQGASYDHDGGVLKIYINDPVKKGKVFHVKISYYGRPQLASVDEVHPFRITTTWAFSFSQPFQARYWFPCFDEPADKAEEGCDISVTVPNALNVASNGYLASITQSSTDKRTHRWIHKYPIATYLIAVSINDYAVLTDNYKDIPFRWYVYPGSTGQAAYDFDRHDDMFRIFEEKFGEYPFDNYGIVMVPSTGWAMEHQSMTTTSDVLVTGTRRYESVMAHELAHMWWGDAVTLKDYRQIWLNEGFASYSEAIWAEGMGGTQARDSVVAYFDRVTRSWDNLDRHSLFIGDYNSDRLFSPTVYKKGAYVLHMLRFELGDDDFFKGLKEYYKKFKYDVAEIKDFQEVMEEVSGRDLEGFFQGWIYGVAWPRYAISSYTYEKKGKTRAVVTIKQVQDHDTIFNQTILVDPDGEGSLGASRMYIDGKWAQFEKTVGDDATDATIVDTLWLLMDYTEGDYAPPVVKKVSQKRINAGTTQEITFTGTNFTPVTKLIIDSKDVKLKSYEIAEDGESITAVLKIRKKAARQQVQYQVVNPDGDTFTKKKGFKIIPIKK